MNQSFTDKIDIYITVDVHTVHSYFNVHDPSPLYKKQINQKFERYILNAVISAKRYSAIFYKLNCVGAVNKQYAEPLMHAIKRHFAIKKSIEENDFKKFKKRNIVLLAISAAVVILLQVVLPLLIFKNNSSIYNGIKNCLDVFSWVILWKPIYDLLFSWNPYLKNILLLKKLSASEVLIIDDKKIIEVEESKKIAKSKEVEVSNSVTFESLMSNRITI